MADRRGPEQGYKFGAKAHYRRNVWAETRRYFNGQTADKVVLLMPSIEGDEIEVVLNNGFREENIRIVDWNKAIAATLKRRYPKTQCFGNDVSIVAFQLADKGQTVDAANLDFTGCASPVLFETIYHFATSGAIGAHAIVSVTLLRGREQGSVNEHLSTYRTSDLNALTGKLESVEPGDRDRGRIAFLLDALSAAGHRVWVCRSETYKSIAGNQTMLWATFVLHDAGCRCQRCAHRRTIEKRHGLIGFRTKGREVISVNAKAFQDDMSVLAVRESVRLMPHDKAEAWLRRKFTHAIAEIN